ncbi:B-cell receptor CD22-like [Polypterus senegalus]|uniref:B-cell receptor CD22-like n=1 Tax=Polypterus senegalus TaxID=55291 RepID=UPI001964EF38|nr:B-cell receptor CD22-like [Polypterus senegalus]
MTLILSHATRLETSDLKCEKLSSQRDMMAWCVESLKFEGKMSPLNMFILIFLSAVSSVAGLSNWGVTYEPKKICTMGGSTVRINCEYRHPPNIKIKEETWFYGPQANMTIRNQEKTVYHTNNNKVSSSHTKRVQFFGNKNKTCSVMIIDVKKEDSGYYKFKFGGTGEEGLWTGLPGVNVTVTDVSEWGVTYESKTICAIEGSTVTINCAYRHPECQTVEEEMWLYGPDKDEATKYGESTVYHTDERHVNSSHRHRVQFLGKKNKICSVKIRNVRREDSGYYKFNFNGTNRLTQVPGVNVTVTGLKLEATAEKVKENNAVTLRCKTNCSLTKSIFSWFRNGQRLKEASEELQIQRVSYEDHGSYSCQSEHITSLEFLLNVEYAPRNVRITNSFITIIGEGKSVTLYCTALANPPSKYTWVKENSSHVVSGEHLHISKVNASHAGSYYCEATNIYGTIKSAPVYLKVNGSRNRNYALYPFLAITILTGFALVIVRVLRKKTNQQNGDIQRSQERSQEKEEEEEEEQTLSYASVQFKARPNKKMKKKSMKKKSEDNSGDVIYSSVFTK